MHIDAKEIPTGSYLLRGFKGDGDFDDQDIDLVAVLANLGQKRCAVWAAKGELSDAVNVTIGLHALALGFHTMEFNVLKGSTVSHRAVLTGSGPKLDHYLVDLVRAAEHYASEAR